MTTYKYLSERVSKVVLDSDKIYNEGARLLANYPNWPNDLQKIIDDSWDTLVKFCIRSRRSSYTAAVKLTFASTTIGMRICKAIGCEPTIKSQLALGDILLEAFLQEGLIEIHREFAGAKAPYIVRILKMPNGIKPTLSGTLFCKPAPIQGLFSPYTKEPFIKGWSDNSEFRKLLYTPHILALDRIRQTGWSLNEPVLEVLKENPPPDHLELADKNGVLYKYPVTGEPKRMPKVLFHLDGSKFLGKQDPRLQKMMSKFFEHKQIIDKADLVIKNGNKFWQEATCDYRGRFYYAESFLEYQGSDMSRSLFLFQEPLVVTEDGYHWMLAHAANSYNESFDVAALKESQFIETDYITHLQQEELETISLDKMTFKDKVSWGLYNLAWIADKGKKKKLMPEAEKPYAFLAVCIEIYNYLEARSNGLLYQSHLPIPIDGANNGWQHLAAVSKDKQAGALVSLTKSKIQKDFYVAVGKELIKQIPDWFEDRNMPMKHIRKGISKRGSMTRAYSAGKQRIAKNMYDDCHMEGFTVKYNITQDDCNMLAGNLITAINTVCAGPLKTTKYLQKLAAYELEKGKTSLEWVTPSGFKVVYKAYFQREVKQRGTIKGITGSKDGRITHVVKADVINKETGNKVPCRRSFASGIAPNYVHSLDASHMAMVVTRFDGCFAAVHDSFATHASRVSMLQYVTKEQFVEQYSVDNYFTTILESIGSDFPNDHPKLGRLKINEVMNSDYFFC